MRSVGLLLVSLVAGLFLSSANAFSVSPQSRRLDGLQLRKMATSRGPHNNNRVTGSSLLFMTPRGSTTDSRRQRRTEFSKFMKRFRTSVVGITFALLLFFGAGIANASTGGRMGGSFGRSSSGGGGGGGGGYSSRSYSSPSRRSPVIIQSRRPSSSMYSPRTTYVRPPMYSRRVSPGPLYYRNSNSGGGGALPAKIIVVGGVAYVAWKSREQGEYSSSSSTSSTLGPGVSVVSLTVAVEVPNRDDGDNILSRIQKLSRTAQTSTRKGVQDLVNNVALELLRQAPSLHSATSYSQHYNNDGKAQRDFQRLSVEQRSKFTEETLNKFNDVDMVFESGNKKSDDDDGSVGKATMAVVTITMCIEGDETTLPSIKNRGSVVMALQRIASDAQVDECLLSAEVLWAPEDSQDRLSIEQVYSSYPDLYPL